MTETNQNELTGAEKYKRHIELFRAAGFKIRGKGVKDLIHVRGLVFDKLAEEKQSLVIAKDGKSLKGVHIAQSDITKGYGARAYKLVSKGEPYVYANVSRIVSRSIVEYGDNGKVIRSDDGMVYARDLRDMHLPYAEVRLLSLLRTHLKEFPLHKVHERMVGMTKQLGNRHVLYVLPEDLGGTSWFQDKPTSYRQPTKMMLYPVDEGRDGENKRRILKSINPMGKPVIMPHHRVLADMAKGGEFEVELFERATYFEAIPRMAIEIDLNEEVEDHVDETDHVDDDIGSPNGVIAIEA